MVTDFFVVELNSTCPDTIRRVVSPATGLADVDLSRNGLRQKIKLPIGSYQYELMFKNLNCSVKIEIKGNVHTANILTVDMDCLKGGAIITCVTVVFADQQLCYIIIPVTHC